VSTTTPDLSAEVAQVAEADVPVVVTDSTRQDSAIVEEPSGRAEASVAAAVPRVAEQPERAAVEPPVAEIPEPVARPDTAVTLPPPPEPVQQEAEPAAAAVEDMPPTVSIAGSVRAFGTGAQLAGAAVSIIGTEFATTTDAGGSFSFEALPAGSLSVAVELEGFLPGTETVLGAVGESIELNVELRGPPSALEPDEELGAGDWVTTNQAEAAAVLGRPVAIIADLWVESLAMPATGTRPRIRVAQLTESGERITMVVSRSGPANSSALPRVTALRIIPPTEAYPITTGTVSFGVFMVTAKAKLAEETLRALLRRLVEAGNS